MLAGVGVVAAVQKMPPCLSVCWWVLGGCGDDGLMKSIGGGSLECSNIRDALLEHSSTEK